MAQTGYTPISLYYSTTASQAPTAGNLANGELAINITDGKLYYKDNTGTVKVIAGTGGTGIVAGSNTQVQFNNNGVFGASANLTFNGTTLTAGGLTTTGNTILGDASSDSLTVNATITSNLIFTDNTYDIGASGATRPRSIFLAGNATVGSLTSGRVTYAGTGGLLQDSANLQFDGTNLSVGIAPTSGVQLYVYAPTSTDAQVRIAVPTGTQATYTSYVNTTVTKIGTENSAGGALVSGSSAYATILSNNGGYPVQVGTNNVVRTTVTSDGKFGVGATSPGSVITGYSGAGLDGRVFEAYYGSGANQPLNIGINRSSGNAWLGWNAYQSSTDTQIRQVANSAARVSGQGGLMIQGAATDTAGSAITWTSIADLLYTGVVFNEGGIDMDFRVESDGNTHMLFVDAGNNTIGVMTNAPTAPLEINSIGGLGGYTALKVKFGSSSVQSLSMGQVTAGNGGWLGTAQYRSAGNWQTEGTAASILGMGSDGTMTLYTNSGLTANTDFNPTARLTLYTTSAVVNEDGNNYDFRVESDNNAYMLWVDASADGVNIGGFDTIQGDLNVIKNTGDGVASTTSIYITTGQTYGTAGATKNLDLVFQGYRDGAGSGNGAKARLRAIEQTGNSRSGRLQITTLDSSGNLQNNIDLTSGEVCINQDSIDMDFRVESDTNTHALFVDAGNSRVGIGESNPARTLDVNGIVRVGYALNQSNPVQNTWYDIISAMDANTCYKVSLQAIKASAEEFAMYETLYVIGGLVSSTRTSYYIVGAGAGLEYRIVNNFPSANQMQVRVTTTGASALRASVIQMP